MHKTECLNDTSSQLGACTSTDCGLSTCFLPASPILDAPPLLDAVVDSVWQRGTLTADRAVQKCAPFDAPLGHGTATAIPRSPLMYLQVLLLIFLGRPWTMHKTECLNDTSSQLGACTSTDCGLSTCFLPASPILDAPPLLDAVVDSVWQRGTLTADRAVQKCAPFDAPLGHGTATAIPRSPLMYLQVLLLIFLGRPWTMHKTECLNDTSSQLGACTSTDCGLSTCFLPASPILDAPPLLDAVVDSVWQRGTLTADRAVQKCAPFDAPLGHGTATAIPRSPLMYLQVGYYDAYSYRDDDVCLLAVSWPPHVLKSFRAGVSYLWCLLVLGGDVELNPGPMTKAQEEKLDLVASSILRLEASNAVLQDSVNKVLQIHADLKIDLEKLTKRVHDLEQKFATAPSAELVGNSDKGLANA
ncbi:uncharacterized protein LOC144128510 [Amblyomma americanum]